MKIALRQDPAFFDLAAWRERLAELRAAAPDLAGCDVAITHAEAMVETLEQDVQESAVEAS